MPTLFTGVTLSYPVAAGCSLVIKDVSGTATVTGAGTKEDASSSIGAGFSVYGPQTAGVTASITTTGQCEYQVVQGDATAPNASLPAIIAVSASRALTWVDSGNVLRCSTAVTLEYPEGLGSEFSCIVESPASGDVTIDPTGSCTANGGSTSLTRSRANNPAGFVIRALAANVAGVSGS
jgi:hypothetical protein